MSPSITARPRSSKATRGPVEFIDCHPPADDIARETLAGLTATPKHLPPKLFYNLQGSRLFERICDTDEYYPTRTELGIYQEHAQEMSVALGQDFTLIEYGSGSSRKLRLLCRALRGMRHYVAIDISEDFLRESAQALADEFPQLAITAICADYTALVELPAITRDAQSAQSNRLVVFFPGSTIGNLTPEDAREMLKQMAILVGSGGGILIGVDCKKDPAVLERAYNDAQGLTARFNLNLLTHLNERLGCHFEHAHFRHHAFYNEQAGRIEMHLACEKAHRVWVGKQAIEFEAGETIHTENSYKYSPAEFRALAREAGLIPRRCWLDEKEWFSVHYLSAP